MQITEHIYATHVEEVKEEDKVEANTSSAYPSTARNIRRKPKRRKLRLSGKEHNKEELQI